LGLVLLLAYLFEGADKDVLGQIVDDFCQSLFLQSGVGRYRRIVGRVELARHLPEHLAGGPVLEGIADNQADLGAGDLGDGAPAYAGQIDGQDLAGQDQIRAVFFFSQAHRGRLLKPAGQGLIDLHVEPQLVGPVLPGRHVDGLMRPVVHMGEAVAAAAQQERAEQQG